MAEVNYLEDFWQCFWWIFMGNGLFQACIGVETD
jgi:hypothetical protein